ncbi:hypothetical protein [Nocardioides sp. cx-173]|uniref:hypothetical protein n=1 Tax=Nocardioides sp. cx-173 TaxID=2898796 RepID=UPI001E55F985|nr:hypothetical protein [Nocardioides sp. cx-173]MCD4525458.1 hypothetical protein [Nocardioides sp. cx-173]UGB42604.1 hypothetical protein LQ940_03540 [Nocardioides sp. cx-173]
MPLTDPYAGRKPALPESVDSLRQRIPGWGADLDPADRPSYPRERLDLRPEGAVWDLPEPQPHDGYRERSIEHADLTPVFGTAQPLHGVSGAIRRLAYERYSEGRAAHWLLLIAGDRVDVLGSTLCSFATRHPDNLLTETGIKAELTHGGLKSRLGRKRADLVHQPLDPVIVVGPWVVGALAGWSVVRRLRR